MKKRFFMKKIFYYSTCKFYQIIKIRNQNWLILTKKPDQLTLHYLSILHKCKARHSHDNDSYGKNKINFRITLITLPLFDHMSYLL
jgi:hypothetical protein